jgi:hypothetical protein
MFDGEQYWLTPGEDFATPTTQIVDSWTEDEEEEPLDPYETPTMIPVLLDTYRNTTTTRFPRWNIEQGWGAFSVAMSKFCNIIGVEKEQYQHNVYDDQKHLSKTYFSFRSKTDLGGRI